MSYLIQQVLTPEEVTQVRKILNQTMDWKDGVTTVNTRGRPKMSARVYKDCYNLGQGGTDYRDASSIIFKALDRCDVFYEYTVAKSTASVIFSRTPKGGFYKPHHDSTFNGHYSNTLFLSDPKEYGDGELSLIIDHEVKNIKLKPGMLVTYPIGVPHEVRTVTRGTRDVAVFWTKSRFNDPTLRDLYSKVHKLDKLVHDMLGEKHQWSSVDEANKDPRFILVDIKDAILRLGGFE